MIFDRSACKPRNCWPIARWQVMADLDRERTVLKFLRTFRGLAEINFGNHLKVVHSLWHPARERASVIAGGET